MKYWISLICCCGILQIYGQSSYGLYGNAGLNRIGFLFDSGGCYEIKTHQIRVGFRLYGPDQIFETKQPGIQFGYRYNYPLFKKFNLVSGIQFSFFQEKKGEIRFRLIDPQVEIGGQWQLSNSLQLATVFSIGTAHMYAKAPFIPETEHFYYLNYEFKVGLTYCFGHSNL